MASINSEASAAATSMIIPSPRYIDRLRKQVPSVDAQKQAGYIKDGLTEQQLQQKKRCLRCGVRPFQKVRVRKPKPSNPQLDQAATLPQQTSLTDDALTSMNGSSTVHVAREQPEQRRCKFHPGKVVSKTWTCCRKHVSEAACGGEDEHLLQHDPGDRALKKRWQFYETPAGTQPDHCLAVSIDCEMGTSSDNESELIRLTVVDYFSGKTLIDTLVYPSVPMQHFNTKWSGVTRSQMERARKQRQCIFGTAAARAALFKYVGRGTFVVGHGLQNDLSCLRWHHDRIVDSYLIESSIRKAEEMRAEKERNEAGVEVSSTPPEMEQAKDGPQGGKRHSDGMSLKALAFKKLGRTIQKGKGHDSLEDAVAARDLVHFYIMQLSAKR